MTRLLRLLAACAALVFASPALAAQGSGCIPTTGQFSGLVLVQDVNAAMAALISSNSGGAAPSTDCSGAPVAGQIWLDTSSTPNTLKFFDGTSFLPVGRLDATNHLWLPPIGGGLGSISAAASIDLCSVAPAFVTVTGTASIQVLGGSCVVGQIKLVRFAAAGVILVNGPSLILPGGASITTLAADQAFATYLGGGVWQLANYQRSDGTILVSPPAAVDLGRVSRLTVTNGSTADTQVAITASRAILPSAAGTSPVLRNNLALTINTTSTGAGGLDTGSLAASTWYAAFIIDNGSSTQGLLSLSSTAPVLPSGYTNYLWVGWVKTDAATPTPKLLRTIQTGKRAQLVVKAGTNTSELPTWASNEGSSSLGSPPTAYVAHTIRGTLVPSTALSAIVVLNAIGNSTVASVAPNPDYATTNIWPPAFLGFFANANLSAGALVATPEIVFESNSLFFSGTGYARIFGWTDSVNAD